MPKGIKGFQKGHGAFINNHTCKGKVYSKDEKIKLSKIAKQKGFGKWMNGKTRSLETM